MLFFFYYLAVVHLSIYLKVFIKTHAVVLCNSSIRNSPKMETQYKLLHSELEQKMNYIYTQTKNLYSNKNKLKFKQLAVL